jgi:hypothetical protein
MKIADLFKYVGRKHLEGVITTTIEVMGRNQNPSPAQGRRIRVAPYRKRARRERKAGRR